jgi:hypothetical protein
MTSGILAVLAILAVFAAIWLFIKIEHIVARIVGFVVAFAAVLYVASLFIGGRI